MRRAYKTSQVAKMTGIHPNTVRLYEECGLMPKPERLANGYRVFTDYHVEQIRLARMALQVEVLQNGLRKKIIHIIKLSAQGEFDQAIQSAGEYINQVSEEQRHAEEALEITKKLLAGVYESGNREMRLTRKQAAAYLGITMDTLRNWELNGLLTVSRTENGYRIYGYEAIRRLKIIRSLRCANYSLSAILRMLNAVSEDREADIRRVIDTPQADEDIVTACDKLLTSLRHAKENAVRMLAQLEDMKKKYGGEL